MIKLMVRFLAVTAVIYLAVSVFLGILIGDFLNCINTERGIPDSKLERICEACSYTITHGTVIHVLEKRFHD